MLKPGNLTLVGQLDNSLENSTVIHAHVHSCTVLQSKDCTVGQKSDRQDQIFKRYVLLHIM